MTKTMLYQGQIVAKLSTLKIINNNPQNLNVAVVDYKDNKPKLAAMKLQFLKVEDGKEFAKVFEEKLEELQKKKT